MVNKIRTTHVGSLPRTPELLEANLQRGELPVAEFQGSSGFRVRSEVKLATTSSAGHHNI